MREEEEKGLNELIEISSNRKKSTEILVGNYQKEEPKSKLKQNTFCENLTFSYLNKVITRGNHYPYSEELLYEVGEDFKFEEPYKRLTKILNDSNEGLSYWTIVRFDMPYFVKLSALNLLNNTISLLAAFFTSQLIDWVQECSPGFEKGAFLTTIVVILSMLKAFSYNWFSMLAYENQKFVLNGFRVNY